MKPASRRIVLATVAVASIGIARVAPAQRVTIFGGTTAYRFVDKRPFGFHTALLGGVALDLSPETQRWLRVGLTVSYLSYTATPNQGIPLNGVWRTERRVHLLPELGLYVQRPSGRMRPYGGVGAGAALVGWSYSEYSLHAALGLDLTLNGSWDARCDVRGRGVNGFGETLGLTFGLTRRL